jgi:hypothetical protein
MADFSCLVRKEGAPLLEDVVQCFSRASSAEVDAWMASLSSGKQKRVWENLHQVVAAIVEAETFPEHVELYAVAAGEGAASLSDDECEVAAQTEKSLLVLKATAAAAWSWASDKDHFLPATFMPLAEALHSVIFVFKGPVGEDARGAVLKLCLTLWEQRRKGSENVTMCTLPCLLVLANDTNATDADARRCFAMREALEIIDMQDDTAAALKDLLARSFVNPVFMRSKENRKFLEYVLVTVGDALVEEVHGAVANHLPYYHSSEVKAFGQLFFRAWTSPDADEAVKSRIAESVFQDMMVRGIRAARPQALKTVRDFLEPLVSSKKVQAVDTLVAALYGPILWRSLEASSPAVRHNALTLLVDAFPVVDPAAEQVAHDAAMKKNVSSLYHLLADPVPAVRAAAAQGVCRVLSVYWEVIPVATCKKMLVRVAGECARDSASTAVRVAAIDGVSFLIDQVLAHPTLGSLLPTMASLLHDRSERVRVAFLSLLCKVQHLKTIKFYDIVDPDELMSRLVLDAASPKVQTLLIDLLAPTYLPSGATASDMLNRVLKCMRKHPVAGAALYANAHLAVNAEDRVKLLLVLHKAMHKAVDTSKASALAKPHALDARNLDVMEHLATVFAIVWTGLSHDVLGNPEDAVSLEGLKERLLSSITAASLTQLLEGFVGTSPEDLASAAAGAAASLIKVVSSLPGESLSAFLDSWAWPCLHSASPSSPLFAAAVDAVCSLDGEGGKTMVDACFHSLQAAMTKKKAKKGVLPPAAAASALDRIIALNPSAARDTLVSDSVWSTKLDTLLPLAMSYISAALTAPCDSRDEDKPAFEPMVLVTAVQCVRLLTRLTAHRGIAQVEASTATSFSAPSSLAKAVEWVTSEVLPAMARACVSLDLDDPTAAAARVEQAAVNVPVAQAFRAASDTVAALAVVTADCVALGAAGDAALALLRAIANDSIARGVAAVPPPAAVLYGDVKSMSDAEAPWSVSYNPQSHGGNVAVVALARLAARFAVSAGSSSTIPGGAFPGARAVMEASQASAFLLGAAATTSMLAPLSVEADSLDAVQAITARSVKSVKAAWTCAIEKLVKKGPPGGIEALQEMLPHTISSLSFLLAGAGGKAVAEGFATDLTPSALSGVSELGVALREFMAPLMGSPAVKDALFRALMAGITPKLEELVTMSQPTGEEDDEVARVRRTAAIKSRRDATIPTLAMLSALLSESDDSLLEHLNAHMPGATDSVAGLLRRASGTLGGQFEAVASQCVLLEEA